MLALRVARSAARSSTTSARLTFVRTYAEYSEGATARSKEFSKKERAHEDQYARQHEQEQLKKLREEIQKKKQEIEALEKEHAKLEKGE